MIHKFCPSHNRFDLISFTFVIFISLSCFYTPQAYGFERCDFLFSEATLTETDLFSKLETFEAELYATYAEANAKFGQNQEINVEMTAALTRLTSLSLELEALQDRALSSQSVSGEEIRQIFAALETERAAITTVEQRTSETTDKPAKRKMEDLWREIEIDPSLIKAEKVYQVELLNGTKLSILFSEIIVNEVFRSGEKPLNESSVKAIGQIKRGIFGGSYAGPGIKKLIVNNEVYELGAIGKNAGTLRFGGYFKDSVLHFVTWSKNSEHNTSSYITRFRDSVLNARRSRGH